MKDMIKIEELSKDVLVELVSKFTSMSHILKDLGYRSSNKLKDDIRNKLIEYEIPYLHLRGESNHYVLNYATREELLSIVSTCKSWSDFYKKTNSKKDIKPKIILLFDKLNISTKHFVNIKKKNLIGKTFGKWTVISNKPSKGIHSIVECKCVCGNIQDVYKTHLISKNSLGCLSCSKPIGKDSKFFKGYEGISGTKYNSIKKGALKRGIDFSVSIEFLWELFISQNKKCSLSGLDISFSSLSNDKCSASLDRVDSNIGYCDGNVQWVHKDVNIMKNKYKNDYFIQICKLISSNIK